MKYAETKRLIPDSVTAPNVHKIFELCAECKGKRAICRYIEEYNIETPSVCHYRTKGNKSKHTTLSTSYIWNQCTVRDMLSNRMYCGDTFNFSTYSKSNKLKKRLKKGPNNILIFENTHGAIVSRELFRLAQLSKKVDNINLQYTCIKEFIDKAKTNIGMDEVVPKLFNLFITRIEVSVRESRNRGCVIKFRFTFQSKCM